MDGSPVALEGAEAAVDRPIDPQFERQRKARRVGTGASVGVVVLAAVIWLPGLVAPSVSRATIRTAAADEGPIESVITASGLVVPEVEEVISSPVDARVLRILKTAGATLQRGEPLVELDVSQARLEVDSLGQDLAIKENAQAQRRLALDKSLIELNSQAEVKSLQLASLRQQLDRDRQLSAQGLLSQEQLKKSELAVSQAEIELKQLERARDNAQLANRTDVEGLALEMAKLRDQAAQARRTLDLASPRADRDGVLTWALTQEGVSIRKGDVIARIADLHAFRVEATVSDVHAGRVTAGLPVLVKINDQTLEGTVRTVLPTIQNGAMTVQVSLANPSSPLLRSNLRVDALIVTDRKARAVRLKRGPFAAGSGRQSVFVVRGDRAVRTPVEIGVTSFDQVEVVRGLQPGDEAVISDMSDYSRLQEVRIR
jgi:HlyD family secretion protein